MLQILQGSYRQHMVFLGSTETYIVHIVDPNLQALHSQCPILGVK